MGWRYNIYSLAGLIIVARYQINISLNMGKFGGWSIVVEESSSTIFIKMNLKIAIADLTIKKTTNLLKLANAIQNQLKKSYQINYSTFITSPISSFNNHNSIIITSGLDGFPSRNVDLPVKKIVSVSLNLQYRIIRNPDQKMNNEHLIMIKEDGGEMKDIYGYAHGIGGNAVSLNLFFVDNIIKGLDNNTIPHELGHTLSLLHVDKQHTFRTDPRQYWPVRQRATKDSTNIMFSGGSRYNNDLTSTTVIGNQINIIIEAYRNGKLNLN